MGSENDSQRLAIAALLLLAPAALAQELPPADGGTASQVSSPGAPAANPSGVTELPREDMVETALSPQRPVSKSTFGGYGELTFNKLNGTSQSNLQDRGNGNTSSILPNSVIDLRRFVLFFGHDFTDDLRFYSEVEFEHAVASAADMGEAEIEQAFLDWLPSHAVNFRVGLILMPMGIINVYHEPTTFNAVDRPDVDTVIIPTTWREAGLGLFGEIAEGLRYQVYAGTSFNANGFNAQYNLFDGHQEADLAFGGDLSIIGRLDWEPILGTVIGAAAYGGTSGNSLTSTVGAVPLGMYDVDARTRLGGFSGRIELAVLTIGDAAALDRSLQASWNAANGTLVPWDGPVSSLSYGGYVEAAYDLLHLLAPGATQGLTLFDRIDAVDTQAGVPVGFSAVLTDERWSDIVGIVYRPIPEIAFKADYRRQYLGDGEAYNEIDSGIAWLF